MINKEISKIERMEGMGLGDVPAQNLTPDTGQRGSFDPLFEQMEDAVPLYPVRVYDKDMNLKREISVKELVEIDKARGVKNYIHGGGKGK